MLGGPLILGSRDDPAELEARAVVANPSTARDNAQPDFSGVRVHTGNDAAFAAASIGAQAFTCGRDIFFGAGRYAPESADGRALLVHELVHVAQNARTPQSSQVIRRYDSFEHFRAGDEAQGSEAHLIQGLSLTSGEINALADFYETPGDLMAASPTELKALLDLIHKQSADPLSVKESDWDKATNGRYTQLNLRNSKHFASRDPKLISPTRGAPTLGSGNIATWIGYHKQALSMAQQSILPGSAEPAKFAANAKTINAFGEHFLTDAFSAGHLFNKDDMVAALRQNLRVLNQKQLEAVFHAVSNQVWTGQSALIRRFQGFHHTIIGDWWDLNSADRFEGVLEGIYQERPDAVESAVVKAVHDTLNTHPTGSEAGVLVENDVESWVLSGDRTLAGSSKTQFYLKEALAQSRANLADAFAPHSIDPDADVQKVIRLVPRPTSASKTLIHDTIQEAIDPKRGLAGSIAMVVSSNLQSLLDTLVDLKKLRLKAP
ncbi:MAG TPA: DUF4157 domain-containing protein [Polyangia bacterium]|nr:DUF4157 domain-containing protein [Polyangia bacterium]